jgi:hypothetical protein
MLADDQVEFVSLDIGHLVGPNEARPLHGAFPGIRVD